MQDIVCTLFEGRYHFGVGALINSLYYRGFEGDFYAGYRGDIAPWVNQLKEIESDHEEDTRSFRLNDGIVIHFIELDTEYHLTNYKPNFMLDLLERNNLDKIPGIFYFDPDIVLNAEWDYLQNWKECGVAVCEDVNSPLPQHHPKRVSWRNFYKDHNIALNFKNDIYVNGGFVGISLNDVGFLKLWKKVQELMAPAIGGLNRSNVSGEGLPNNARGIGYPFNRTDQDALNISIEAYTGHISFISKEGMGFKYGANVMLHALGKPKPWDWKPFTKMIEGRTPGRVEKAYWSMQEPIKLYKRPKRIIMNFLIKFGALVGRFYSKN